MPNRKERPHGYFHTFPIRLALCLSAQRADVRQLLFADQSPPTSRTNRAGAMRLLGGGRCVRNKRWPQVAAV